MKEISIVGKKKDTSTCKVMAKKAGTATVTYTNKNKCEVKYKITVSCVKGTKKYKLTSCGQGKLDPNLGKGTWKTSNSKIVSIIGKTSNKSTCTIRAKKTGTATVTYKNQYGCEMKYTIKVSDSKTYPLDNAYFTMNYADGLEPVVLISNNSDKKIKYVYLTVSFYNAVGDIVENEIGRYKTANLKITGPIKPWEYKWFYWDAVFYNSTAVKMKVQSIKIEYFDGTSKKMTINKKYPLIDED